MARSGQGATARRPPAPGPRPDVLRARVRSIVEPIVRAASLDLEDLAVVRAGHRFVVRVIVDGDGGVDHDELGDVSRDISNALDDAEETGGELTPASYTLEVSSPGVDRPLTLPRHWRRNVGRLAKVKAGDRGLTARIIAVDDAGVTFDGHREPVPFHQLGPGHIQIEFSHAYGDESEEEDEA